MIKYGINYGLIRRLKVARSVLLQLLKDKANNINRNYKEEMIRTSGDCICEICNEKYYDHPHDVFETINGYQFDFLHIRCDGQRLKL